MGDDAFNSNASNIVMMPSGELPVEPIEVKGYDFNKGINHHELLNSFLTSGFQATNFGMAVEEINKMIDCKQKPVPLDEEQKEGLNPIKRKLTNCTIFLGFTSNMISSGVRDAIRYLCQHNLIDCIVSSAGGIEEDFIKCLAPTYLGDFNLSGKSLRSQGMNRIGNLIVPNSNYCKFEDWVMPILDQMLKEQKEQNVSWTPSKMIARLGKEIDNPDSVYYWCYKNNIPVFSPGLTDGSLGDMLYFHRYKNPGLILDIIEDIQLMNNQSVYAVNTGMIILGGGIVKHHICNANLMRNGANFSVFVNSGNEFDGSDSGARPDEAVSWGKIRMDARPVKVYGEASIIFPLLLIETFSRYMERSVDVVKQNEEVIRK